MYWYGGSIAEAVTLSKQKNAIFVVFVEGDNELSQEMLQTIDDTAVLSRLSNQDNFLAIKLKSGSTNYTHFAQIYQFVPVPSLFFIGRNGTPLEVVCAGVQANNLATRIDRIIEEHYKEKPSHMQPSTSSQNIKEQTASLLQAEASAPPVQVQKAEEQERPETSLGPAAKVPRLESEPEALKMETDPAEEEYEVVCSGDVCVRRPKSEKDAPSTSKDAVPDNPIVTQSETQPLAGTGSAVNVEGKLEKALELIEARRREKAEKEKESEKQKELERRATGKGVAELKKWQAEQEFKQIQEERKREKMENNLARQRILEQIAQDRAERRARDAAPAPPQSSQPPPATPGDVSTGARIQFKMPDGTSHTAHFEAEETLGDVQRYVAQNLQLSASSFSLWTAFPRRELTDRAATLRGLELAPSAALLVLPIRTAAVVATPSTFSTLITFITQLFTSLILEPSQQLYQWVRVRLFPPAAPRSPSPVARAQPPPPPTSGPRRRGNVHRLPGDRGEDDDNNTWNGNSTQQM